MSLLRHVIHKHDGVGQVTRIVAVWHCGGGGQHERLTCAAQSLAPSPVSCLGADSWLTKKLSSPTYTVSFLVEISY